MEWVDKQSRSSNSTTTMVNVFIQERKEDKDILELPKQPLPPGWIVAKSRKTGCPFYYNESEGRSQWVPPQHVIPNAGGGKQKRKGEVVSPSNGNEMHGISNAEDQRIPYLTMQDAMHEEMNTKRTGKGLGFGKGNTIPPGILAAFMSGAIKGKSKTNMKGINMVTSMKGFDKHNMKGIGNSNMKGTKDGLEYYMKGKSKSKGKSAGKTNINNMKNDMESGITDTNETNSMSKKDKGNAIPDDSSEPGFGKDCHYELPG